MQIYFRSSQSISLGMAMPSTCELALPCASLRPVVVNYTQRLVPVRKTLANNKNNRHHVLLWNRVH